MIRVALLTTWGDRCGTSEHARHIVEHAIDPEVAINVFTVPVAQCLGVIKGYDIVHVNESGWIMQGFRNEQIAMIQQALKCKVLLTMNASCPTNNKNPFTNLFDQVVVFEPHTSDGFAYVPIGAPVFEPLTVRKENYIGTNGFPQERKNLLNLAEACQEIGFSLMAFIPDSPHANAKEVASEIKRVNPSALTIVDWVSDEKMLHSLSRCIATCYPYIEWFQGSSSAIMAGVSARVSIIVSRASQFDFLFSRTDEVYFIEAQRPSKGDILEGLRRFEHDQEKKIPNKIYQEHRWDKVGQRYIQVYKEMMGQGV
jgi:hypothetical protein